MVTIGDLLKEYPDIGVGTFRWNVNVDGHWEMWDPSRGAWVQLKGHFVSARKDRSMKFVSEFPATDQNITKISTRDTGYDGSLNLVASNRRGDTQVLGTITTDGLFKKVPLDKGTAERLGLKLHLVCGRWYWASVDAT